MGPLFPLFSPSAAFRGHFLDAHVFPSHTAPRVARGPLTVAPVATTFLPPRAARGGYWFQSSVAPVVHVRVAVLLWSALVEGLSVDAIVLCVRFVRLPGVHPAESLDLLRLLRVRTWPLAPKKCVYCVLCALL